MPPRRSSILGTWWMLVLMLVASLVLAHLLDRWAFHNLTDPVVLARLNKAAAPLVSKEYAARDTYQLLRQLGSVIPWVLLGVMLWLIETDRREPVRRSAPGTRPMMIISSVLASGLVAEIIKPFVGRMRPEDTLGEYRFFTFNSAFSNWSDCGIPSSHGAVAFAGALAVSAFHPRAGWVLFPLACGTCWTRVANANHFLSDVVAGAVVAFVVTRAMRLVFDVER